MRLTLKGLEMKKYRYRVTFLNGSYELVTAACVHPTDGYVSFFRSNPPTEEDFIIMYPLCILHDISFSGEVTEE